MAFTPTNLSTTPLLETTFISDMRLIVNSNVTLLRTQIEDVINELQIDLVNKYIGVDSPIGKVYTQDAVVSNQILLKNGTSGGAATIASLTQSAGVSTFLADNISFTKTIQSTTAGSKVAVPTVVIGTTTGGAAIGYPTSGGAGIADKGLYVGDPDSSTAIPSRFYGEANFAKQAIQQSSVFSRTVQLVDNGGLYSYANLKLAKTDPQFIYLDLILPSGYTQTSSKPIWLLLHEDYTTLDNRPATGQTFTFIINRIFQSNGTTEVAVTSWPTPQNPSGAATLGINIISGYVQDAAVGAGKLKTGYLNSALWNTLPGSGTAAVAATTSGSTLDYKAYIKLFNTNVQSGTVPSKRGSSVSLTKTQEETNSSYFTITNSHNITVIN
jgi:hypothetical protein